MIKKLKSKIFFIIFLFLSIIVISVFSFFTYNYYNTTIHSTASMIEKVYGDSGKSEPQAKNSPPESSSKESAQTSQAADVEGFYYFIVKDSRYKLFRQRG